MQDLKKLKEQSGMTFNAIAEEAGIPIATVHDYFSGRTSNPRTETLQAIKDVMLKRIPAQREEGHPMNFIDCSERCPVVKTERTSNRRLYFWLIFVILLCIAMAVCFIWLYIYDIQHPDRGWFEAWNQLRQYSESLIP